MLLEAFSGALAAPEDVNPCYDPVPAFPHTMERLRAATDTQQPLPVPDQMALVWRIDVMRLMSGYWHRDYYFQHYRDLNITVTQNQTGEVVAVTRTDAEGQIKEVIWMKP